MKEEYVVYDRMNNAVWVNYKNRFGKHHRFKTQKQAYAKARQLALQKKMPIYDKMEGKDLTPKRTPKKRTTPKRSSTGFDGLW